MPQTEWIILGISGVSCSGKSTLAKELAARIPCVLLQQDKYFLADDDERHVPCDQLAQHHNDYDILSALDMTQMMADIQHIINDIGASESDATRANHKYKMADNKKLLIIEGFTILNYGPIMDVCTLCYYMDLPYEECRRRREARTYDPPDVEGYYDIYVWPRHIANMRHLAQQHKERVHIMDGCAPIAHTIHTFIDALRKHGLREC